MKSWLALPVTNHFFFNCGKDINFTVLTFKAKQNMLKRKQNWIFHIFHVTRWQVKIAEALRPRGAWGGEQNGWEKRVLILAATLTSFI